MLIFYALGVIVCMYLDFLNRDRVSANTPETASWAFWWKNNRRRIYISLTQYMEVAAGLGLIGDGIFIAIREMQWWYRQ